MQKENGAALESGMHRVLIQPAPTFSATAGATAKRIIGGIQVCLSSCCLSLHALHAATSRESML